MSESSIIVLKDANVKEIILHILGNKAKAYRYCNRVGDLNQAEKCYEQWTAITQVCDALGIKYLSLSIMSNLEFEVDF